MPTCQSEEIQALSDISEQAALVLHGGYDQVLPDHLDCAPGVFFTLRREADGRMSIPFLRGRLALLPGLTAEALKHDAGALLALCVSEDVPPLLAALERSAHDTLPCSADLRLDDGAGGQIVVEMNAMPQARHDGSGAIEWCGYMHDVTASRGYEAARRAQSKLEEQIASIAEAVPGFLYTTHIDAEGVSTFPFASDGIEDLFGVKAEDIHHDATPLRDRYHPDDLPQLFERIRESYRTLKPFRDEIRVIHPEHGLRWIDIRSSPHRLADGTVEAHGLMIDITERKTAELALLAQYEQIVKLNDRLEENARTLEEHAVELEAVHENLRMTEAWYRSIIYSAPDAMFVTDERGLIILVNDTLCRMFGYAEVELLGQPMEVLLPADVRPGHEAKRKKFIDDILYTKASHDVPGLRARRKDGSEFGVDITLAALPDTDFSVGTICVALRDVSERRRMEEALRLQQEKLILLFENSPLGIVMTDEDGRYVEFNDAFRDITGYTREELQHLDYLALTPPGYEELHAERARSLQDTGRYGPIEKMYRRKDGKLVPIQLTGMRITQQGDKSYMWSIVEDISERKRAERRIGEARARLHNVLQTIPDLVWLKDVNGVFLTCNHGIERFYGASEAEIVGKTDFDFVDHNLASFFRRKDLEAMAAGRICINEEWVTFADNGQRVLLETRKVPVHDADGKISGVLGVGRDITDRKRIEDELAMREREFRSLVENTPDTVARFGRDLRRLYVNPAVEELLGVGATTLIGLKPSDVPGGTTGAESELQLSEVFATGLPMEFEQRWTNEDGKETCLLMNLTPEFGEDGEVESILAIGRDITELNAFRRKIHQMAFYDQLTGLPNRALFNDRLRQMLVDASYHGQSAGVMMIDMDRFKAVNDTMGHAVGDELLREAAMRLTECVRGYDTVARLGGDEFAVLLPEIRSGEDLGRIANKILSKFDERFLLEGKDVFVSCSIGISVYPTDSDDAQDLLKFADSAMYFAKRSGRNNFRFYSKNLTTSAKARLTLESELRRAIERHELELHYQPKISLHDGRVTGSEALLRWRHPIHGQVSPCQFIQIAEDTGLIIDIGKWVLHEACRTAAEWNAGDAPLHKVAINLSARQFQSSDLIGVLNSALAETGCRPRWIELEITESLLLDEDGKVLDILRTFRAMGISIAIDDFGTGYSALSYLARFPIDTLKIDRSFINTVTTDKYRAELVRAILSIARCLGQQVVAEGVETVEQAAFLASHGCQVAQGFLYSKAVPKSEFASLPKYFSDSAAKAESSLGTA